jgi:hypothetical protein
MPSAMRACAQPGQISSSTRSLHVARPKVPQALSLWPYRSVQFASLARRKRVSAAPLRNFAWFSADAFQPPPGVPVGWPTLNALQRQDRPLIISAIAQAAWRRYGTGPHHTQCSGAQRG